jgi:ABC-type glycerol-3-phosphate transport system permease component
VFVACAGVVIQLFFSSLAGFALAKYEFRGKQAITLLMLATLLIPGQVTLAPTYELIYRMGLVDTYAGLLVPGAVSVFGIFLFRQAMLSVPTELIHAARIDGCSEFQIYWQIVIPTVRPMIGAFVLIAFMGQWNSFLWPQIILHSAERFTLPIALTQMVGIYQQQYGNADGGHAAEYFARDGAVFVPATRVCCGLDSRCGERLKRWKSYRPYRHSLRLPLLEVPPTTVGSQSLHGSPGEAWGTLRRG